MIFRQLFDRESCTYTYILGDEVRGEAIVIDPVHGLAERDEQILAELGLVPALILETHVHADHVTGAGILKTRMGGRIGVSRHADAPAADLRLEDGDVLEVGQIRLEVRETPGHTSCSVTFVTGDGKMAFTGDTLLIRGCGRTDFQAGDPRALYRSVHERIFTLPDDTKIYPGHDYKGRTMSTVGEEKRHNPRLAGTTMQELVEIMDNLGLPPPKHIDVAVPGNLMSGYAQIPGQGEAWALVSRTTGGVPEVSAEWLDAWARRPGLRLVDVREPEELEGPLSRIDGVEPVPLADLEARSDRWNHDERIVLICRSGNRSGQGAVALEGRGFTHVASLAGGMLRYKRLGLPTAG